MNKRVVVTGVGIVSPLGLDVALTWQGLIAGRPAVGDITTYYIKFQHIFPQIP